MTKKRIPLTVPMKEYWRLKKEADLAEQSMNQYIFRLLKKRKVIIVIGVRQIYSEIYRIRTELERLKSSNNISVEKLVERVDKLCRFCDTFLVDLTKIIN